MRSLITILTAAVLMFSGASLFAQTPDTLWFEDWETGWNGWYADNGLWQVGAPGPEHGPDSAYSGSSCAGTILNGHYTTNTSSRLISPLFDVPSADQMPRVKFFIWHRLYNDAYNNDDDFGYVQVKVDHPDSIWRTLSGQYHGYSPVWCQSMVDLSQYAELTVQLAFRLVSDNRDVDDGVYIDDVSIVFGEYNFSGNEDFEDGWGDWYADNGVWQVGTPGPDHGPNSAYSGNSCVGTILNGHYMTNTSSRLISPPFVVESDNPRIYLQSWHRLYNDQYHNDDDFGYVQVRVDHPDSNWLTIDTLSGYSPVWTQFGVNLSEYVGERIRMGFLIVSDNRDTDAGWYIDYFDFPTHVFDDGSTRVPVGFLLKGNYPNPFNPSTSIAYSLSTESIIRLEIYNLLGQHVATLYEGMQQAGEHIVTWNASDFPSGIYFARLEAGEQSENIKMVLLK